MPPCQHKLIRFRSGDYFIYCETCPAQWMNIEEDELRDMTGDPEFPHRIECRDQTLIKNNQVLEAT